MTPPRPEQTAAAWQPRPYRPADAAACAIVFETAVRDGAARHYDAEQRTAWISARTPETWAARLADQTVWVGVDASDKVLGFFSLTDDGVIDFAFVLPQMRGTGLADALLNRLVDVARTRGLTRLTTEASLIARSFFARNGWEEERRQTVWIGDVSLDNFVMSRKLGPAP